MDGARKTGGITRLWSLAEAYPEAFTYDFRALGISTSEIGVSVDYDEAWRLAVILLQEPTSWLRAQITGWKHPVSREFQVLADLFDLQLAANSKKGKKPKPYPRPWATSQETTRYGGRKSQTRTAEQIREILARSRPSKE